MIFSGVGQCTCRHGQAWTDNSWVCCQAESQPHCYGTSRFRVNTAYHTRQCESVCCGPCGRSCHSDTQTNQEFLVLTPDVMANTNKDDSECVLFLIEQYRGCMVWGCTYMLDLIITLNLQLQVWPPHVDLFEKLSDQYMDLGYIWSGLIVTMMLYA